MSDYQVMPPLSVEEYAALKADIAERGVLVPVVYDQHGNVLDGHHRQQIAVELGIDCPTDVRHVDSSEHARDVAFTLNLARRHLTREQKRQLISAEVKARPGDTDRAIGRRMGCDHKTVGSVRRELSGEIPQPQLTPAQRREACLLFELMRARTAPVLARIRSGEPIGAWCVAKADDADGADVQREAWRRFAEWANSADETHGVLWDHADTYDCDDLRGEGVAA